MSAIRLSNQFRPRAYRMLSYEELRLMLDHLTLAANGRHWQLLMELGIETATQSKDLACATWPQISPDFATWTVPAVIHGKTRMDRPIALTSTGKRIVQELMLLANPADPRLFHPLPASTKLLSYCFGRAAKAAGVVDFGLLDIASIGIAKRVKENPQLSIDQIAWSLGWRHGKAPRFYRAYRRM